MRFKILLHNVIIHPIAGIFWAIGWIDLGDRVHEILDLEKIKEYNLGAHEVLELPISVKSSDTYRGRRSQ